MGLVRWPSAWMVSCDWACACDSEIFMGFTRLVWNAQNNHWSESFSAGKAGLLWRKPILYMVSAVSVQITFQASPSCPCLDLCAANRTADVSVCSRNCDRSLHTASPIKSVSARSPASSALVPACAEASRSGWPHLATRLNVAA